MKYKKILSLIISLVLILIISVNGFAVKTATVYAGDINALPGDAIFIPIQIKDNPGLMGFKITVSFDSKVLTPRVVSRGTVTEKGMFENSVGAGEESSFDIVWNNTSETKMNGTIAVVSFNCSSKAENSTEIALGFSQENTFNEKYEDVPLTCENFNLVFDGSAETSERTDKREVSPEDIVLAVEAVQGDPQITPTAAVMESVNSVLSQITGNPEPYFNSPDEITVSYNDAVKETFAKDVLQVVEAEKVAEIVQNALNLTGAGLIDEIPEDMRSDFINNVESALKEEKSDVKELSDYISQEDEILAINNLFEDAQKEIEKNNSPVAKITDSISKKPTMWTASIVGAIITIAVVILLIIKLAKKKRTKWNNNGKN